MIPKEVDIEDHADRIDTICTYIDLLPGNHNMLTDMEKKSLLFNTFPKTWRSEFTLNQNNPELASEKEIKDFMEKKKELADKEDSVKERAKTKLKKLEDSKKKRNDRKGNQPCRVHKWAHLWKDCPANPKNCSRGNQGGFSPCNRNFGRGYNRGFETPHSCNNMSRNHPGRGFGGRSFSGRGNFQGRTFDRDRRSQQEHFYQQFNLNDQSDNSTLGTNQSSNSTFSDWDNHSNEAFHNYHSNMSYGRGRY